MQTSKPRRLHWVKKKEQRRSKRPGTLTPEEQACTLVALKWLAAKHGSLADLAFAAGIDRTVLRRAERGKPPPTGGLAVDLARVAGVPVDDVLAGRFPEPGACPMCGRSS